MEKRQCDIAIQYKAFPMHCGAQVKSQRRFYIEINEFIILFSLTNTLTNWSCVTLTKCCTRKFCVCVYGFMQWDLCCKSNVDPVLCVKTQYKFYLVFLSYSLESINFS